MAYKWSMTLCFAYIDGRHTIHVADRRISVKDEGGLWTPKHDNAIKIVEPRGSMLLSYTGAADLDGDTAQWLLGRLNALGADIDSGFDEIAAELTQLFSTPGFAQRTLTAALSGWVEAPDGSLQPVVASITNKNPSTKERLPKFEPEWQLIDPLRGGWITVGVPLSRDAHNRVDAAVQSAAPKCVPAAVIANIFLHAIRRESTPTNGVSASAIGVVYPEAVAQYARTHAGVFVSKTETGNGMIMPAVLSKVFVPEQVTHFATINLDEWDWSQLQVMDQPTDDDTPDQHQ